MEQPSTVFERIIRFFLEQKMVAAILALLLIGWGLVVAPFDWDIDWLPRDRVPVDALPDIGENQQIVITEWPGRSPREMHDQVTYPLTTALLGVPGVHEVRSQTMFGVSMIFMIFEEDVEFYWSRARIIEKLNALPAGLLPEGVQPALGPDATGLSQIYWYTLEGRDPDGNPLGGWDLHELRTIQDWQVRYGLASAGGVAEVGSIGGFVKEFQVDVDPDALRAADVSIEQVVEAVSSASQEIGARTTEINRVEYLVRVRGFVTDLEQLEKAVVRTGPDRTAIRVRDVASVQFGPAERRGVLTHEGVEAVGGVVAVREGYNPMEAIQNVRQRVEELAPGLPRRAVIDWEKTTRDSVERFADRQGFDAFTKPGQIDHEQWLQWMSRHGRDLWPDWLNRSQITIVPFYDRTGLIDETLGTLNDALVQQVLVTIIVIIVMVLHLRASVVVSMMLPLAVLMCFIGMKLAGVTSHIVSLAGIAIAIGTIVDMGLIVSENVLRHLGEADRRERRIDVVFRATREVGSAVLTAIATTVVSFLPVFFMIGEQGRMYIPLAYTKTFVLIASVIVAITIVPAAAHLLIAGRIDRRGVVRALGGGLAVAGVGVLAWSIAQGWMLAMVAGTALALVGVFHLIADRLPGGLSGWLHRWPASILAAVGVTLVLSQVWEPLGPEPGAVANFLFVAMLIGSVLGLFHLFIRVYPHVLRFLLACKGPVLAVPVLLVGVGLAVWLGFERIVVPYAVVAGGLLLAGVSASLYLDAFAKWGDHRRAAAVAGPVALALTALMVTAGWLYVHYNDQVRDSGTWQALAEGFPGLDTEPVPKLDEGSFLWMPVIQPHGSIGEALEYLKFQDQAKAGVPEVETVTGKIGRAESALDPAPVSMVETLVTYKTEYITDDAGRRVSFAYDRRQGRFVDEEGELLSPHEDHPELVADPDRLVPDPRGRPYRQWRSHISSPRDIWHEIEQAARVPGITQADMLHPIETRQIMIRTGMRAQTGLKVRAPDLATLERAMGLFENVLATVPAIRTETIQTDRVQGKPYLDIVPDRERAARYGVNIADLQRTLAAAAGGMTLDTTIDGRERFPIRVRYQRERRHDIERLERIFITANDGTQVPLSKLARVEYVRGPEEIRAEDTFLTGFIFFGLQRDLPPVDGVREAEDAIRHAIEQETLIVPDGVTYRFAGQFEQQLEAERTLRVILPVSLAIIFLILYFQFRSSLVALMVFSGIAVAWAGGFLMIHLYAQPWFGSFDLFGVNMRELFQLHPIKLSVAVWVGFLALFGIASDDGVVMATYLKQSFARRRPDSIAEIREATIAAGMRRVRPCLMTSATTILALMPVLTSTGRGSEIMIPMAIPTVGGMTLVLITMFTVPLLFCLVEEVRWRITGRTQAQSETASQQPAY